MSILTLVITFLSSLLKSQRQWRLENLALRQPVAMLQQSVKCPRVSTVDRAFWILFSRYVDGWRNTLHALHPDTVLRWHRRGFRLYWRWKSRGTRPGRPPIDKALLKLIQEMQATNMGWGAPRVHGELLKLDIEVSQATVSKYMLHPKKPPSKSWRTFLHNHQDCLDHVIVFNERHLGRILRDYFNYYHSCRTHLSLNEESPKLRAVEPESLGNIVALPRVGGLHHRYTRAAA